MPRVGERRPILSSHCVRHACSYLYMPSPSPASRREGARSTDAVEGVQFEEASLQDVDREQSPYQLDWLPDEILHYILGILHQSKSPREPFHLRGRSLERAAESHAFSQTCRRVRSLFRSSVQSLAIQWDDIVGTDCVKLFAPSLRHLIVSKHAQSERMIEAVATYQPTLETLKLSGCACDHYTLSAALRGPMRATLRDFSLEYINSRVERTVGTTIAALAQCKSVRSLNLHGIGDLTHASLMLCLTPELEALSIGYLRHVSMGSETLREIGRRCTGLNSLVLHDTRWATAGAVVACVGQLGHRLRLLSLDSCRIGDTELLEIVNACPNIVSLAVRGFVEQASVSGAGLVAAVEALGPKLLALDVHHTSVVSDEDVSSIVQAAPHLRELRLRNSHRVTNSSMKLIAAHLKDSLKVLDVTGTAATDIGMIALSKLTRLEYVSVGATFASASIAVAFAVAGAAAAAAAAAGMGMQQGGLGGAHGVLPQAYLGGLGSRILTNAGVEELMLGCGRTLRRVHVESGDRIRRSGGGSSSSRPLLAAEGVLRSVARHCRGRLEVCCLLNMSPPLSQKVQRARLSLAMISVEEQCPEAVLYIDREPPELPPLAVAELCPE